MRYRITIAEVEDEETGDVTEIYVQTVDYINISAIINAVNTEPPTERKRALRSDAGKPRKNPIPMTVEGEIV